MVGDEQVAEMNSIQPAQIDALLLFRSKFVEDGFSAGRRQTDKHDVSLFPTGSLITGFLEVLDENGHIAALLHRLEILNEVG